MTADLNLVRMERRDAVGILTLDRPDALNALSRGLLEALEVRIQEADAEPGIRGLVITGEGRAFAAGADIAEMRGLEPLEAERFSQLGHRVFGALEALPIPVVAAVNGFALGGGCELACACDWIYAGARARFGQPEVALGLVPGFGGTTRLARKVGAGWARELVLTGEPIDAETAQRIGLANRVFDDAPSLLEASVGAAAKAAEKGPVAVAQAKRLMVSSADADLAVANTLEQTAFGAVFATHDRAEGMDAFLAKRDPKFEGR
ncbi:MAG: enoyl-CoA hydratase-related protein [Myxococcota bacterium]|nr:enoyl-CoA hydratase-related protein [Myxococcota bacterium]